MSRIPTSLLVALGIVLFFAYALYETQTWSTRSRTYGIGVAAIGLALALGLAAREAFRLRTPGSTGLGAPAGYDAPIGLASVAWTAAFFATIGAVGLLAAVPLFSTAYLRLAARASWPLIAAYAVVSTIFIYFVFVYLLYIPLPAGLLFGGRVE